MKLLSGQPLYMSKHITSQIAHSTTPKTPFQPPQSLVVPCISTRIYNHGLKDMSVLYLRRVSNYSILSAGEKIDQGSFKFNNLPATFTPCFLIAGDYWENSQHRTYFTKSDELRKLHWFDVYPFFDFFCATSYPHEFLFFVTYYPGAPGVIFENNTFICSALTSLGFFQMIISMTYDVPDEYTFHFDSWTLPNDSLIGFTGRHSIAWTPAPSTIQVYKEPNGTEHVYID
jgi:hypothetical protein